MYSPKEGEEWEGGGEEKLLLLKGNKNTERSMCRAWGEGLSWSTGSGIAATCCDGGRAPLPQTTLFKASLRLERY